MSYLIVFLLMGSLGVFWAKYIFAVQQGRALAAAFWDSAIVAAGAVVVLAYVGDVAALIPAIGGTFAGTYLMVRINKGRGG